MLNFIKSNNQNDFISTYSLPIYKQIAPQFFRKTNKRNKYLSFYQKQPRLFYTFAHKICGTSAIQANLIAFSLHNLCIRLAAPQQFKQT